MPSAARPPRAFGTSKVAKRGKNLLTPVQLQHWVRAREPIARTDGDGLTFTLSAAGTATWVLRYQFGGRSRELTLGNYPDISLPAARQIAREKRVEIDKGGDPANTKKQEKIRVRTIWSIRELAEDYREKIVVALAESTQEARNADLDQVIIPKLGAMLVTSVTSADIVSMIADSGRTWTMCKRLRSTCNRLFAHALGKRLIHVNPTVGIDLISVIGQRPPVRRRLMLSQDELRALLPDINSIGIEKRPRLQNPARNLRADDRTCEGAVGQRGFGQGHLDRHRRNGEDATRLRSTAVPDSRFMVPGVEEVCPRLALSSSRSSWSQTRQGSVGTPTSATAHFG